MSDTIFKINDTIDLPMKKTNSIWTIFSFLFVSLQPAGAQDQLNDTLKIEEVVVTGTPVKVNRNNVPMAVSVVGQAAINESDESALLPVLNGRVPGLFVTERGVTGFGVATGSAGQITIRGIGGNPTTGVLMLIDGHPQFMGIMGHPLPDSYVASDVERVEVIRGPASVLYGSNAMGGVINIITKKQDQQGFHGNARVMAGSYNTQKYMGSGGFRNDKFSAFASVDHDQTDGHRNHSDFDLTNAYLKLGYEISKNLQARTDFSLAKFKASDPGPDTLNAAYGQRIDITRGYWAVGLDNEWETFSGSAKFFYNFGEHDITDGFHSNDRNYGLNIYETAHLFAGNSLTLGFDQITYGGKAENRKAMNGAGIVFADTTVTELGLYGFVQQKLAQKLTLNAGIRYQRHSVYGSKWIPSAGLAYETNPKLTLKANVSKGFRSPTIRELFMWAHNPKLNPEEIWNYETGMALKLADQKVRVELTGFMVEGDNLIVTTPYSGLQNAGSISNKGIELGADAFLSDNLTMQITYSYTHMKQPVYATPEQQLFISARYRHGRFLFSGSLQHVHNLDTEVSSAVAFQSYTLANAKVSYQLCKYAQLFVSAENLLGQHYETNRYYPMPGTTAFGGINLKF